MFICNESVMNGTVTMDNIITLIDKPTFEEAVSYFKEKCGDKITHEFNDSTRFSFRIKQNEIYQVYGYISNKEAKVI